MQIQNVNNSQTAFNGYVGENVKTVLNKAVKNSISELVHEANAKKEVVEGYKLINITNKRTKLLKKLKNYMEPFHQDSYMDIDNCGSLFIKNDKLNRRLFFRHQPDLPKEYFNINYEKLEEKHIDSIDEATDVFIRTHKPEATDTLLFDLYARNRLEDAKKLSLFGRIKTFFAARKLDKLAPEFNVEGGWKNKLKEVQIDAKKEQALKKIINKIDKKEKQKIIKNNNKMAENIF